MFQGHVSRVRCLSVCGDCILSGSDDRSAKLWSSQSSSSSAILTLSGHAWPVSQVCLSRLTAVTADSCSVRVWSLPDGNIARTILDQPNIVELYLDCRSNLLVMCDVEGGVGFSDVVMEGKDCEQRKKDLKCFWRKSEFSEKCTSKLFLGHSTMIHVTYDATNSSKVDVNIHDFLC